MKVILLSDVAKVGKKYAIIEVAPGYARNFLIARDLAEAVTRTNAKRVAELTRKREVETQKQAANLEKSLAKVNGAVVTFMRKANEEGHLYAGVTKDELAMELGNVVGASYVSDHIDLEKPIKELGMFTVKVTVAGKNAEFTVKVEKIEE